METLTLELPESLIAALAERAAALVPADPLKLSPADDQDPVEAFAADGGDPIARLSP